MRRPPRRSRRSLLTRRSILAVGVLAFLYPLLRFIGFRVPRKPQRIEITKHLLPGQFHSTPQFILFTSESKVWAVARRCTHLGCTLHYLEKEDILECPCHQSRFSKDGLVLNGPARKALKVYPVEQRDTSPFYIVTL